MFVNVLRYHKRTVKYYTNKHIKPFFYTLASISDFFIQTTNNSYFSCVLKTAQQHLEIPIRNYSEMNREGTFWVARVAMRAFILLPGEPLLFKSRLRFCPGKCHGVSNMFPTLSIFLICCMLSFSKFP